MKGFLYKDLGRIKYEDALARQTAAFDSLLAAKAADTEAPNRLFFCERPRTNHRLSRFRSRQLAAWPEGVY